MEEKIIQNCKNCKFFIQHYVIKRGEFCWVGCGQCTNENFKKSRKPLHFAEGCALWEGDDQIKEKEVKNMCSILEDIENQLNRIKQILQLNKES